MSERVLAIDPGERVGWAHGVINTGTVHTADGSEQTHSLEVTGQGVTPLQDFAIKLGKVIADYDTVVYEVWRLYPHMARQMTGNDMQPSQLVGIIRYLSWINPVKLVSQGANIKRTAEKTMPDAIRERMALSSEQHDQDALMHLWHYYWQRTS